MTTFSALFAGSVAQGKRPLVILDGGMGTTLQAPPFECALDSVLWSSELLGTDDGHVTLTSLHQAFVDAGAEVLGSCSYQSSLPLFLDSSKSTFTPTDLSSASHGMCSALSTITKPFIPSPEFPSRPQLPMASLALGPFGAQLVPGAEYSGLYPEPFGPSSVSTFAFSNSAFEACPLPSPSRIGITADRYEDQLAAFHLRRLEDFSASHDFTSLPLWAFETIPLVREAKAIRRAVSVFRESHPTVPKIPFYIAFVFPVDAESGIARCPDAGYKDSTPEEVVEALVEACFGGEGAMPDGVGVNCTNPLRVGEVVKQISEAVARRNLAEKPWLVVYPDGGAVYDVVTRTWANPDGITEARWGSLVAKLAADALAHSTDAAGGTDGGEEGRTFGGVLVGGCCKAGPGAIRELRKECEAAGLL